MPDDFRNTEYCPVLENVSFKKKKVVEQIRRDHKRARDMHQYIYPNKGPYKKEFMAVYNGKCAYCGASIAIIPKTQFEIDHFIYEKAPIFNGSKEAAGDISNLVLACHSCNHKKSSFIIDNDSAKYLYPDSSGIRKAFIRDDQYYIKVSDECEDREIVTDFYRQLNLGGEIHRLDYLLMSLIGMNGKIMDKPEASAKIGQAIQILLTKRNIMA